MTSVTSKKRNSNSQDKVSTMQPNMSRDSTHYRSSTSGLPHLLSSIYVNYRDRTLSLTKTKRFSITNSKSVFKFKDTEKIIGNIKAINGNTELANIRDKTKRLQEEVVVTNIKNSDLAKKLNLIKYISKTRSSSNFIHQTNNYLKECAEFSDKYKDKRDRLTVKLCELNSKILEKQNQVKTLEKSINIKKQAYMHLRMKRDAYTTLKRKASLCADKCQAIQKQLDNDKEVAFAAHELILQNEKLQLEKLQHEIARYLVDNSGFNRSDAVRRLIFEAKGLEIKRRYAE